MTLGRCPLSIFCSRGTSTRTNPESITLGSDARELFHSFITTPPARRLSLIPLILSPLLTLRSNRTTLSGARIYKDAPDARHQVKFICVVRFWLGSSGGALGDTTTCRMNGVTLHGVVPPEQRRTRTVPLLHYNPTRSPPRTHPTHPLISLCSSLLGATASLFQASLTLK